MTLLVGFFTWLGQLIMLLVICATVMGCVALKYDKFDSTVPAINFAPVLSDCALLRRVTVVYKAKEAEMDKKEDKK